MEFSCYLLYYDKHPSWYTYGTNYRQTYDVITFIRFRSNGTNTPPPFPTWRVADQTSKSHSWRSIYKQNLSYEESITICFMRNVFVRFSSNFTHILCVLFCPFFLTPLVINTLIRKWLDVQLWANKRRGVIRIFDVVLEGVNGPYGCTVHPRCGQSGQVIPSRSQH